MSLEILGQVIYIIGNIGYGDICHWNYWVGLYMSLEILGQVIYIIGNIGSGDICHWKYWVW